MATQGSVVAMDVATFSTQLLESREVLPRARTIAQTISDLLPGSAAVVYLLQQGRQWTAQCAVGEVTVHDPVVELNHGTFGTLVDRPEPVVFSGRRLVREEYAHVSVRRTLHSLAYLPLIHRGELAGAIELLNF